MLLDRKCFYKYVTFETALQILQNRKVRYSSPLLFNDPFDIQTRLGYEFEELEFLTAYRDEMFRLLHGEADPAFIDQDAPLCREIQIFRKQVKGGPQLPKKIFDQGAEEIIEGAKQLLKQENENINAWWTRVAKATRVFCVAETHDNLLMWAHYTRDHKGAVVGFQCLPDLDTALCTARKVNYTAKPPFIATKIELNGYIKYITGQTAFDRELTIYDLCLSKSDHWRYEQEWRVFIMPDNMDNPTIRRDVKGQEILFDLLEVLPQEIHSIYLGCRMSDDNRHKLLSCLNGDFKHVRAYNSVKCDKKYELNFEELL